MPALPPVPNVVKIQLHWNIGGDTTAQSRYYIGFTGGGPTIAQANTFAGFAHDLFTAQFQSLYDTDTSCNSATVTDLTSATAAVGNGGSVVLGTRSGGYLPAATCAVVNHHILRRYRGGKPRTYLPIGTQTDLTTAKVWSTTFTAAVTSAWNTYISNLPADAWTGATITGQVNVSYYEGFASDQNPVTKRWRNIPTPRVTPLVDVVASNTTLGTVGSQRRRNKAA